MVATEMIGHDLSPVEHNPKHGILELAVLVVIVQNFVVVGMMLQGQLLERLQVPAAVIPNAFN
ncbi:MAG: hypothetical protein WCF23_15085 [Candidatus Nitrosopolaris sp.]